MKRMPVRRAKDKRIFKRTATRTKKVNVAPVCFRGGTRL